jgi:hypothetical protein
VQRSPGHVVEEEDFLLLEVAVCALGQLGEEDDGDPARGRPDAGADHQLQVHAAGHHQKADEDRPDDRLPVEAFLELGGRGQQVAVFLELFVFFHGKQGSRVRGFKGSREIKG